MTPLPPGPDAWTRYGCLDRRAEERVEALVDETADLIRNGTLADGPTAARHVHTELSRIAAAAPGSGATDTIVKENVFRALAGTLAELGLSVDRAAVYDPSRTAYPNNPQDHT
jgi:hypothetical protein